MSEADWDTANNSEPAEFPTGRDDGQVDPVRTVTRLMFGGWFAPVKFT